MACAKIPLEPTTGRLQEPVIRECLELLEGANQHLVQELAAARREVARLRGENPQRVMDDLLEELNHLNAQRLALEKDQTKHNGSEPSVGIKPATPRSGHGPHPQTELPEIEEEHDLAPEDRICDVCKGELMPLGQQFESNEEIDVIQLRYVRKTVKRRKWRCRCNGCIKTAPGPTRLIPGGRYSLDFALHVAENKYLDHLPLERQARRMGRFGLKVSSQTLWDQINALSQPLKPTYDALGKALFESSVLHADETRWPNLEGGQSPWFVWSRSTPKIAHYTILGSKSAKSAQRLFQGYEGIVVVDGYAVYEVLARAGPGMELAHCWAQVRRKFADLQENFPKACTCILSLIRKLYDVEAEVRGPFPGDTAVQRQRSELRNKHSRPILSEIRLWAETEVGLPRSDLGKAVRYMLKRWASLNRLLEHPDVPLDNNAAERALRGPVVGRKNHCGSKSKRGTEVAAIFYSLMETAKLCGVNPAAYVKTAAERALEKPGAVTLPWDLETQS